MRFILAPTELANCAIWFDAMDSSAVVRDGSDLTSQWSDKTGNGYHATEGNPTNRPTYRAAGFRGSLPCIDWGAGQVAARRLATPAISYGPFTYFAVVRTDPGCLYLCSRATSGSNQEYLTGSGNPNMATRRNAGGVSSRNVTPLSSSSSTIFRDGAPHIVTRYFGGTHATNQLRLDGVLQQGATYVTNGFDPGVASVSVPVYIGNTETANSPLYGVYCEYILYTRMLTEGEMLTVERYLARKWGVAPQLYRMIASPLEVSDCGIWLDAAQGIGLDGSSLIQQWNDSSGNGRHWAQAAPAQRLSYTPSNPIYAGRPSVDWLTPNASLYLDRLAADTFASPVTIVTCGSAANNDNTNIGYFANVSGSDFSLQRVGSTSWQFFNGAAAAMPFAPPAVNRPFIAIFVSQSPAKTSSARLNRTVVSRGGGAPVAMSTMRLGSLYTGFQAQNWVGSIAEHMVYRRRLVDGELALLESYLNSKYAALAIR